MTTRLPVRLSGEPLSHRCAALCSVLWMFLVCAARPALADVQLQRLDAVWRYQQTMNLDGQSWQLPTYDDSAWPTGKALLFVEGNVLVSPRNTPLTIGRTTYYFRTHLTCPFDPTNVILTVSSRIDDGAVFYLNGQEIQRVRMPAVPAVISYTNLATATPAGGDATASDSFTLFGTNLNSLQVGDNLLAVEVHQNATNSDDIVFGAAVTVKLTNAAPFVVQQPSDVSVVDGRPVTLFAAVDGNPAPTLQWYQDGSPLPGATNALLNLTAAYPANAGTYWLAATNIFGGLVSSNAVLTVLADTNPPAITSAVAAKDLTSIDVSFSEPVLPSTATATNNYQVVQTALPFNQLDVTNVSLLSSTSVRLQTTMRTPGLNYSLRVNGLRDISSVSNQVVPNTETPLTYLVNLVPVDALTTWRYSQLGSQPATNWASPAYDDSGWPQGAALLAAGTPLPVADTVRTPLALQAGTNSIQAYYFRTSFDLPGPADTNGVRLYHIVDDGAVFYLNGTEIYSIGMPPARPVLYTTAASRSVGTATYEPALSTAGWRVPGANLTPLSNCLAAEVHQSASGLTDVSFGAQLDALITHYNPKPQLVSPAVVLEGAGTLTNQVCVTIQEPQASDLVLQLTSSRPDDVSVPATVTIPAGSTNAPCALVIGNDSLLNGPRLVTLTASSAGLAPAAATLTVLDDETNTLTLTLALGPVLTEGAGTVAGTVRLSQPADAAITVGLASSDPTALTVPPTIVIAQGATSAVFQATVVDDLFLDSPQLVTVTASVTGWPAGSATVVVNDNEPATFALTLPTTTLEGSGVCSNAASLTLGGLAVTNMVVALASSLPSSLIVPTTVTIPAGQSNVLFSVTVPDNYVVESNRLVTVTATAPGLPLASAAITVIDNDPDHIRFGPVPSLVDTNSEFGIQLTAENADGTVQTNFTLSLSLVAEGLEGRLTLEPTNTGNFFRGQKFVRFRVAAPGHAVRLRTLEYPGQSDAFTVIPPAIYAISQPVADFTWHAASQTLLASVPTNGGVFSNCLVAIDLATGLVTNSYPIGYDPSQIEASPGGNYLYVAISNRTTLRRFDMSTRVAGRVFALGTNTNPFRFAYDYCVPPGMSDSVVVEARDQDQIGNTSRAGIYRYDGGVRVSLPNFYSSGAWLLESLDTGYDVALCPPLVRGSAQTGAILATATNFLGTAVSYRGGQLFDDHGNFYSASSLAWLGAYPNVLDQSYYTSLPEVDPALRRAFYLAGYFNFGSSMYKLRVYDRDLLQPLFEMPVPGTAASPTRFLRCGTNLLAYVTGNGRLWFIRPDATQPPGLAADLALSFSALPPVAVLGSNYTFLLTLSNAGPGVASIIRITNALPVNGAVVQASPSTGAVVLASSAFTWNVAGLPPGSNATLAMTLRFNNAGWQTNRTWALGFEADPAFANNLLTLPVNVQLAPEASGVFTLNYASEDLLYDPARDRLLLTVGTAGNPGQVNGLALLNPYNGLTESFTALGKKPSRLVRSDNGQYLYVSLPDDALVRRFNLPTLTQNLEFALGGESFYSTWYPYYVRDLAAVPGAPESLVAWRVFRPDPMSDESGRGIALYQNGIMASNVTAAGGSWKVVFDSDAGTLFGYSSGDLRRCSLSSNGVSFVEQYPTFQLAGSNIDYAAGQLFTSAGKLIQCQPFRVAWAFAGVESAALVEADAASSRVFFLVQTDGWQLKAYDVPSRRLLGSVSVPNVMGTPTSLVRWGTNGLAFRTTSNQVFIVRTPLAQPSAAADLAVGIEGPDAPVDAGKDALLILTLTNRGPSSASSVVLTNTFSPAVNINWSFCTEGSIVTTNGQVVWTLPQVQVGQDTFAAVVIRSAQPGAMSVAASVAAATPEAQPGDNFAFLALPVGGGLGSDDAAVLQLAVNDMVWSPSLGKLLLSSSNSTPNWAGALLSLDPATLAVRQESFLGSDVGRLAASRDDSVLYAGIDYGVGALTLPDLAVTNRFLISARDSQCVVCDMEVVPGSNQSLVVASRSRTIGSMWLGAYDGSQARTNIQGFFSGGLSLEFGDDPSLFYCEDFSYNGFQRYSLDPQGISPLDASTTLLPSGKPIELKWANGLLYTGVGVVIDPVTRQAVRAIPGLTNNSPLCYDAAARRVFYLMPVGSNALLQAIDAPTAVPLGSRMVTGYSGTPSGLVRWGADGLAFRTSSGQIALLRSGLVPSGPAADLQVSLSATDTLAFVGSNFVYSVTVTNMGLNAASNAQLALRVPATMSVVAASSSQGTMVIGPQQAVADLGTLLRGATAQAFVTAVSAQPGSVIAIASATSGASDPDLSNNTRSLTNSAVLFVARDTVAVLNQAAADLVVNPANGRLYVSGNGAVAVINPAFAQVETNWAVPTQPGRLVMSGDGQALCVSHDSGRQLARLDTVEGSVVTNFSLGTNSSGAAFTLVDMEAIPGTSGSLVVNEAASGYRYLAVMDDSVARSNRPTLPSPSNGGFLEFGSDPSVVYVSGLMPIVISSNGAAVVGGNSLFSTISNFKYDSGWFYTDAGQQVDPTNRIATTRFAGLGTGTLVVPEVTRRRVYFLSRVGAVWQLRAYDPLTTDLVGTVAITNVFGTPSALTRWGDDGLAFCTTSNQVFLLRPSLVPGGASADLRVTQTPMPAGPVGVGSNVTFIVQITNFGPASASGVELLSLVPTNTTLVQAQLSQGTTNLSGSLLTCTLGTLTNGGTAQLALTLRPLAAGALVHRVTATSANIDPDLSNNTVTTSVGVQLNLSPDLAGIVGLQTADIAYDPVSGLIYASLTNYLGAPYENAIVTIDPATGLLGAPIPVGPQLSQLAVTDDGSALYALVGSGSQFRRLALPSGQIELAVPFSVATGQSGSAADDLRTVPHQREALAVILRNPGVLASVSPALVAYDNATARPKGLMLQNTCEFFATNLLLGWYRESVPQKTTLVELTSTGLVAQATAVAAIDGTMKAEGGLIYTSGGSVFDPMTLTRIRSFGVSGPVAPDHAVNRVCFLTGSSTTKVLRVFDTHGWRDWGSLTISNVSGTVDKLLRCGADRLAFRTSAGQVYILRCSSIPTGPAADLAVGLLNSAPTSSAGQLFSLTVTVTNLGPSTATAVVVSNVLPASMTVVSAEPSTGFVTGASPALVWQVGSLAASAVATNHLVLMAQQGGAFSARSIVWATDVTDANADNDSAGTTWFVHSASSPAALRTLALPTGDLIWEPNSQRLLLSVISTSPVASNTVLALDPVSGQFDPPIPVGAQPGRLAASDDGQILYVGQDASQTLAKLQWPSGNVLTNYWVGKVLQIELSPAYRDLCVLLGEDNMGAYLDGARLPVYRDFFWDWPTTITRPDSNGRFYGYIGFSLESFFAPTFYRMTVNPSSGTVNDATANLLSGADTTIECANGLVFASSGSVLQPETLTIITNIPDIASSSLVRPDPASGLLTFLTPKSGQWWLRQYFHANYALTREFRVPFVSGTPKSLVRWGADGLAFRTTSNQVYLVRPSLAFADLAVTHTAFPGEAVAGQPFQLSLAITNYGASFAPDAYVTNTSPPRTTLLQAGCSQGTVTVTNNQAVFALGSVSTNTVVALSLTLMCTNTSDMLLTNAAYISSPFTDSRFENNSSLLSFMARADTDRDGMPDYWELAHGLNPTNAADAALDSDGDGTSNLQEYVAGTNPFGFDGLKISSVQIMENGAVELTVRAAEGVTYALETSTNLVQWSPLSSFIYSETNCHVRAAFDSASPARFFRIHATTNQPMSSLSP